MVDLAKIRKKAKQKEEPAPAPTSAPATDQPPATADRQPATDNLQPATDQPTTDKLEHFRELAGSKRANFVAEAVAASAEGRLEVLTFTIGGEQYAVGIDSIVEIVTPRPLTKVPNADASIVGIISLRGTIVTLVDVRSRLRHAPRQNGAGADPRIIVAQHAGETVGFEVDRVLRVVKTEAGEIEPHPVVHASEQSDAIRGVFQQGGSLTILLDLDKLLR
jgi:purine-binding chemotaxis protein CheW